MDERANNKESTKRTYREYLHVYLFPKFSDVLIADITEAGVAQFQCALGRRLSASRANSAVNLLRSILKSCVRRGLIKQNPSEGVRRLDEPAVDVDPLTREELELALSCILPHYRPIFTALAWTGASPCELQGLRWRHVLQSQQGRPFCKNGADEGKRLWRENAS